MRRWLPYLVIGGVAAWWLLRSRLADALPHRLGVRAPLANTVGPANTAAAEAIDSTVTSGLKNQDDSASIQGAAKDRGSPTPPADAPRKAAPAVDTKVLDGFGSQEFRPGGVETTAPPLSQPAPADDVWTAAAAQLDTALNWF